MNKQLIVQISKSTIKFMLIILIILLSSLGILTSIAIYNYNYNIGNFGDMRYNYILALSEKTSLDGWRVKERHFNTEFSRDREFGEFRRVFVKNQLSDKKLSSHKDPKTIGGKIYTDGKIYRAEINPETFDILIHDQPVIWKWHWYNWLGIGIDKVDRKQ